MLQVTDEAGEVSPISFDWEEDGEILKINIDSVISSAPFAEPISGAVGERYECLINGKLKHLFYRKIQPRKWFVIKEVNEIEYNAFYKLGE